MRKDRPPLQDNPAAARLRKRIYLLVLVALVFMVFANTLSNGFVFDDVSMIENNAAIRDPKYVGFYFTRPFFSVGRPTIGPVMYDYYRPMVLLSYLADYSMWGLKSCGWHLSNIALHAAAAALVFLLLERLKLGIRASFAAAAIFAVHPALADSVAGVSGRSDPLCAVFFLASIYCYLGARREKSVKAFALYSGACFTFASALLSKENAFALPLVLMAYELTRPEKAERRRLRAILPFCLIALVYFLWRSSIVPASIHFNADHVELGRRTVTAAMVAAKYVLLMFLPHGLGFETFTFMAQSPAAPVAVACAAGALAALASAVFCSKRFPMVAFFTLWFFACMAPYSYFFLFHPGPEFFTPPHFLYLPSIGLAAILGLGIDGLAASQARKERGGREMAVLMASVLIVVLFCAQTIRRNMLWRDDLTFFSAMVRFAPRSERVHVGMANSLMKNGQPGHALAEYARALELTREKSEERFPASGPPAADNMAKAVGMFKISDYYAAAALAGMGDAYAMMGETDNSIRSYKDALSKNAFDLMIHMKLARSCERAGRFDDAIESYERALRFGRGLDKAASFLQIARRKKELFEEARAVREMALRLNQRDSSDALYSEALMMRLSGEKAVAADLLRKTLEKDPEHFGANMALGRILAEKGEDAVALGNFSVAFAAEPTSALAAYELAVTNLVLRNTLAAKQWAAKAYDLSPDAYYWDFLQEVRGIKGSGRVEE